MKTQTSPNWSRTLPDFRLKGNEIHLWCAHRCIEKWSVADWVSLLSEEELNRANQYRYRSDAERFGVRHGILRTILGGYLGKPPQAVVIDYTAYGKPIVGNGELTFSLSHSGAMMLYAIARDVPIGVDVEFLNANAAFEVVASHVLTLNEQSVLEQASPLEKRATFLKFWTRKEALSKALGMGLSLPINKIDVSASSDAPTLVSSGLLWLVVDLSPVVGYVASLVAQVQSTETRYTLPFYDAVALPWRVSNQRSIEQRSGRRYGE